MARKRQGVGRTLKKKITHPDPEQAIREIKRLSEKWTTYHEDGWSQVKAGEWDRLVPDYPAERIDILKKLLGDTEAAVKSLAEGCDEIRVKLAPLLAKATRTEERDKK